MPGREIVADLSYRSVLALLLTGVVAHGWPPEARVINYEQ